jgi:hypothetical protein
MVLSVVPIANGLSVGANADPYCSPWYYPSYTIRIYNINGDTLNPGGTPYVLDYFSGIYYKNGDVVTFKVCAPNYSLRQLIGTIVQNEYYSFYQWSASTGHFSDKKAQNTYFYPALASGYQGSLAMILQPSSFASPGNWAGYVVYGPGVNTISATFYLPSALSFVQASNCAGDNRDIAAAWIGIGPANSNPNLFQIGYQFAIDSGNTVSLNGWTAWLTPTGGVPYTPTPASFNQNLRLGDQVYLWISYDPSKGATSYLFQDLTHAASYGNTDVYGLIPDNNAGEWVVETRQPCYITPNFSPIWFQLPSVNTYPDLNAPLLWTRTLLNDGSSTSYIYPGDTDGHSFSVYY